jgi:hypothetical protein
MIKTKQHNDRLSSITAASALTTSSARLYGDNDNDKNDEDVDEDGAAMQKYCNDINQFDLKFMYYRLFNNGVFVMASCFYVAMDIVPYSGLTWFADDDDDAVGTTAAVQAWLNRYAILYFVAACLFVVVGIIDLYLVKLGAIRAPHEVEQQIINRANARVRATTRRTTMRGVMITIPEDDKPYDDNNEDIFHHENNPSMVVGEENNNNSIAEMDHTVHVWIEKMKFWCCCSCRLPSTVVVVAWSSLLAGLFGISSSVLVVHNLITSNILNAISVHLFFIQACAMYYARFSGWRNNKSTTTDACDADTEDHQHLANDPDANDEDTTNEDSALRMETVLKWWYIIGDTAFGIGALIDVIFSYVYIFSGRYFVQAIVTLLSGILWWTSSIMYGLATLYDYHQLRQDIHDEAKEIEDILTTASQQARCSRRTSSLFLLDRREQRISQGYNDDAHISTL